ncbi:hypothetical protein [Vibrio furnissii]|uniref:hypothetical protein n=1 Tax=Vibrio furnissii TaxID=29494 RepID=UPI001EE9B65B|nr:hypothetical protein [Vibrio furnissii]MCG6217400.1 hypothetical protein [Vibrio furnissii]
MTDKSKGRLILVGIVLFFALPALVAQAVLSNHWYQSGATNTGELIEPRVTMSSLGVFNPLEQVSWQMAYVVPASCTADCQQQIYLLAQSHTALGKEQSRVTPVLLVSAHSDTAALEGMALQQIPVNTQFMQHIEAGDVVIVDPLGQLVMRFAEPEASQQIVQSRKVLADLRKLLKLSRVG